MPEMTPLEAAEKLEFLQSFAIANCEPWVPKLLKESASYLRKIASGEYAPLSCKMIVPNGIGDCAGLRDEWFKNDFCRKCRKYGGALMGGKSGLDG